VSGGGEFYFLSLHHHYLTKGIGETTMDESFVQGIVGGVLNRHKDRTLDKKRIQTLMVEIAANIDVASQYTNVKGLAKDNPLSIEMWKGHKPNKTEEEELSKEYLDYWTCEHCGKNTHEVDYDYLGNGTNHLQCDLIAEDKCKMEKKDGVSKK
tara:strand:- start:7 stop:465 length:459 start_codon:yes stop_codon:yes gene_type:complete